jgi:large repetitive protein
LLRLAVAETAATIGESIGVWKRPHRQKRSLMRFTRVVFVVALFALVAAPVALALRFTDDSFNTAIGYTGQPYSFTFHGAAGCGPALPYQYRMLSGGLPPGLSLSTSGTIGGVPTQTGNYSFWVELSDENPPSQSWCVPSTAQREFTISIQAGINILQNALNPKGAFLGQPYSFQLTTDNPAAASSWTVISGALPPGISLNSSNGTISGTPTGTGDYTFKIKVTDAAGVRGDSETYTLSVVPELKIGAVRKVGETGVPYSSTPGATGGKPAYTWSLAAGTRLPAGLTLDTTSGAISGAPTAPGTTSFQLVVTDSLGLSKSETVSFATVAHLSLAKLALPAARAGAAYNAVVRKAGGARPFRWTARGLPRGLKLIATGRVVGTPKAAGTYRVNVRVADILGAVSTRTYLLKVAG